MKYTKGQFTSTYYKLWEMGLSLPTPVTTSTYIVQYLKNGSKEFARMWIKANSVCDALERACYCISFAQGYRPEDVDLVSVKDEEENILWLDEPFYSLVQKKNEFRGMQRRDFLARFGHTSLLFLLGSTFLSRRSGATTINLNGIANGFPVSSEIVFGNPGSYTWTVPVGVNSVSAICVGAGGCHGGGGGALRYKNNISVTAGQSFSVIVGATQTYLDDYPTNFKDGEASSFASFCSAAGGKAGIMANGGGGAGGSTGIGDGGGNGGAGGVSNARYDGYSGYFAGGGGGVGIFGQGANGLGAVTKTYTSESPGCPPAGTGSPSNTSPYGYGQGAGYLGYHGAVRIIWGTGRSFPSNAS